MTMFLLLIGQNNPHLTITKLLTPISSFLHYPLHRAHLALASRRPLCKAAGASTFYIKVSHFPAYAWKWLDLFFILVP